MRTYKHYLVILAPTLILVMLAIIFLLVRIPTDITVKLHVNRIRFTTNKNDQKVLDKLQLNNITIQDFKRLSLQPKNIYVADINQYNFQTGTFPAKAWTRQTLYNDRFVISSEKSSDLSSVSFYSISNSEPLAISELNTDDKSTIEWIFSSYNRENKSVNFSLRFYSGAGALKTIAFQNSFYGNIKQSQIFGVTGLSDTGNETIFKIDPSLRSFFITNEAATNSIALSLSVPLVENIRMDNIIDVSNLEVHYIDPDQAKPKTALLPATENSITYNYTAKTLPLSYPEILSIHPSKNLIIHQITITQEGFVLLCTGTVDELTVTSADGNVSDRRISLFHYLTSNPVLTIIVGLILWSIPTTAAIYKYTREN